MRSKPHVEMATTNILGKFSPNGDLYAYYSPDGVLNIWETFSQQKTQEFTPTAHLSAVFTCLSWSSKQNIREGHTKKKRRTSDANKTLTDDGSQIIALGTSNGSILLYDVKKADLMSTLSHQHTDRVTSIVWNESGTELFSSSVDGYIVHWNLATLKVIKKWRADPAGISSICLSPNKDQLISANMAIKVWNISNHTEVKCYKGHASHVTQLITVPQSHRKHKQLSPNKQKSKDNSYYILSAAADERHILVWLMSPELTEKSIASFMLQDHLLHMGLKHTSSKQVMSLMVLTQNGSIYVYEHILNGASHKPLKHKFHICLSTDGGESNKPQPLHIIGSDLIHKTQMHLNVAYGNCFKTAFESLEYSRLEPETCLVRKDPTFVPIKKDIASSNIKTLSQSGDVKVLAPGFMSTQKDATAKVKRKKTNSISQEVSIDERLSAMNINKSASRTQPRANDLVVTLTQSLQSNDKKLLNNVLQHGNIQVIESTVRYMPVTTILPLLKFLAARFHGHGQSGQTAARWLKALLTIHTSYLATLPDVVNILGGIHELLDSKLALFVRMSRLQGKLDILLTQASSQSNTDDMAVEDHLALCTFHDVPDDEIIDFGSQDEDEADSDWKSSSSSEEEEEEDEADDVEMANGIESSDSDSD